MATTKATELGQLGGKLTVHNENITLDGNVHGQYAGFDSDFTNALSSSVVEGLGIDVPATNLTGTIPAARLSTATTQAESDDSTKIATTAYVVDKITTLIGGAPSTLNDLNELAAAINDDANYNSTLTTALATKLPLAGGTLTGDLILSEGSPTITLTDTDGNTSSHIKTVGSNMELHAQHGNMRFRVGSSGLEHMRIAPGGDISFYEDTGTTAKFFWDASAEKLGIGTTPNNKLTLSDGSTSYTGHGGGTYLEVVRGSGADAGIILNKDTGQWMMGIDNSDGTNPPLRFEYSAGGSAHAGLGNGTVGLTLNYQGRVGIGTASPGVKLDIDGSNYQTNTNTSIRITDHGNNTDDGDLQGSLIFKGRYWSGDDNTAVESRIAGLKGHTNGNTGSALGFFTQLDGQSGSTEKVRITSEGYVGIGETNPQGMLHVKSTRTSGGNLWSQIGPGNATSINIQNDANATNTNAAIYFRNSVGEKASIGARFINQTTGETQLRFSTTNSSGASSERMTLDGDGNVGIGTDNPEQNLHIKRASGSDTGGQGHIILDVLDDGGPAYALRIGDTGDDGDFHIDRRYAGTFYDTFSIDRSTGDVKITNSAPTGNTKLIVHNNSASNAASVLLRGERTSTSADVGQLIFDNSGKTIANVRGATEGSTTGGALEFWTAATSSNAVKRWYISSGGDLYPGSNDAYDIGSTTAVVRNIYTGDLHLSNENKTEGNSVDGTKGNWTIQEGEEDLFIINNKTGKKYAFTLKEIE